MDIEIVVQILVAAQDMARLAVAIGQWSQRRRRAQPAEEIAAVTPVRITADKEVRR